MGIDFTIICVFGTKSFLTQHINSIHERKKLSQCNICKESFIENNWQHVCEITHDQNIHLNQHIVGIHEEIILLISPEADKSFF